jgi:nucleotide-binding universal stress UspA family protein
MQAITHIITPVDLEEHSNKLIEYAAYMADKLGAKLTLIHVLEPIHTIVDIEMGSSTLEKYTENRLQTARDFLQKLAAPYPECTTKILQGVIVDAIVDFAKSKKAEMIIIGTHGSKGIEKLLLGSVAERVVKNAHCPTLVMNPFKQ